MGCSPLVRPALEFVIFFVCGQLEKPEEMRQNGITPEGAERWCGQQKNRLLEGEGACCRGRIVFSLFIEVTVYPYFFYHERLLRIRPRGAPAAPGRFESDFISIYVPC